MPQPITSRRTVLAGMGALALSGCHPARQGLAGVNLRVWRYKTTASHIMDAAGLPPPPYQVTYADLPGGQMVLNAFAAGALDYSFMSQIPPIYALRSGSPMTLIASYNGDTNNGGIMVARGSSAQRVEDLRGRTVTFVPATNDHFYLLKLLDLHGLTIHDIQPVPLTVQEGLAAFRAGHVEAITASGVGAFQLERDEGARWVSRSLQGVYNGNFVIAARPGALDDPLLRAAISDYLRREQAAWAWVAQHPREWSAIVAGTTGIAQDLYLRAAREQSRPPRLVPVNDTVIADQQAIADFLTKVGLLQQRVDVRPLWQNGLL
jgi:sulfonate transport system substrate-binding protein